MSRVKVLVYGTLRHGERAEYLLGTNRKMLGAVRVPGFDIYHLGSFPGIRPNPTGTITCDLFEIDESEVRGLDRYEGEGSLYIRDEVELESGDRAFIYIYNHTPQEKEKIESGEWKSVNYGRD